MLEGDDAAAAVAQAARRTTARRDLARREHFAELSPEVGVLDESAFDDLLAAEPDEALSMLAELTGATDERLRRLAHRLAGRVVVDLALRGTRAHAGIGRLERRPMDRAHGDLELDSSLDAIVAARGLGEPVRPDDLVVTSWQRPDTALCLLVDRSGSMQGERLADAALAAAAVVLRAPRDSSVIAFGDDAIVLKAQGEHRDAEQVISDLLRLRGFGVTDLGLALRAASEQLDRSRAGRRLTLLLSDCRATAGDDPLVEAATLDELAVLAPQDDRADADAFAMALGLRCAVVDGPSTMAEALAHACSSR